jgi:hypothetical protein
MDSVRALGQRVEVARDVGQAGAVHRMRSILQHADAARDIAFQFAHARLDLIVGVAERLEAFGLGPFEEGGDFLAFFVVRCGFGADAAEVIQHGGAVAAHHGGVARHHDDALHQHADFGFRQVFRQQHQHVGFQLVAAWPTAVTAPSALRATGSTAFSTPLAPTRSLRIAITMESTRYGMSSFRISSAVALPPRPSS